ncbi:hypothetical protein ACFDR9_000516 [Janthinobacterium sp. CG_23.3]|uniref:TadE/TadG family type IV pilus assembly protein n=1 Tax=unclassified Janthinobacterium TaxID=2610881 RepID=UPI0003468506|nr:MULTISPECIES: TadE/TadG family type IV pilus assembly protein [unclassified Janthinobacterium]MEC5158920.1 hypothetical protein [Janthinobacterium sp. CG_S6]
MAAEAKTRARRRGRAAAGRGVVAVEFALLLAMFLGVVYLLAESAHAMFLAVTLQDTTRRAARAAAVADFSNAPTMQALRRGALLADANGKLRLGGPIDASYLRIDYLSLDGDGVMQPIAAVALPACPALNRAVCFTNPNGAGCIRFVRARLCRPGTDCTAVAYPPLIPLPGALLDYNAGALSLNQAATVVPAETLGYDPAGGCP